MRGSHSSLVFQNLKHMHTHAHAHALVTQILYAHALVHTWTCAHAHTHLCTCTCIVKHPYARSICTCTCTCAHADMHTRYAHAHTRAHASHACTLPLFLARTDIHLSVLQARLAAQAAFNAAVESGRMSPSLPRAWSRRVRRRVRAEGGPSKAATETAS